MNAATFGERPARTTSFDAWLKSSAASAPRTFCASHGLPDEMSSSTTKWQHALAMLSEGSFIMAFAEASDELNEEFRSVELGRSTSHVFADLSPAFPRLCLQRRR